MLRARRKESVLASLAELGHDPWAARGAILRMEEDPTFKAARRLQHYAHAGLIDRATQPDAGTADVDLDAAGAGA